MRRATVLLMLLLLTPASSAAGDASLAEHLAQGGQILVRLTEKGSAAASASYDRPGEEEGQHETGEHAWTYAWSWNVSGVLSGGLGRLGGMEPKPLDLSMRASLQTRTTFVAEGGGETFADSTEETTCELDGPSRPPVGAIAGSYDAQRGVIVLQVAGVREVDVGGEWDPCSTAKNVLVYGDGYENETVDANGPSELAASIHALDPAPGSELLTVEVPLAEGETVLPRAEEFAGDLPSRYCGPMWAESVCSAEGRLVVTITKGAVGPGAPGASSMARDDATANTADPSASLDEAIDDDAEPTADRGTPAWSAPGTAAITAALAVGIAMWRRR